MSRDFIKLTPKRDKIVEALLFLIERAQNQYKEVTQFDLVKSLFIADTAHLETYGRPVTYDNYSAMKNGPVASEAYDMLKGNYGKAHLMEQWPLWSRTRVSGSIYRFDRPVRAPNLKKLSTSDRSELIAAQDVVWSLGFGAVSDLTHEHRAYKAAWNKKEHPDTKAFPMNYKLLVPGDDEELVAEIAFASGRQKVAYSPGDIVRFYSTHAGKKKYHLCLSLDGHYIFVNSEKQRTFAGDFVIPCTELPFLTATETGNSTISCTVMFHMSDSDLRLKGAQKMGSISVNLMRRLLQFAENSVVLSEEDKETIINGLGDWV